MRKSARYKRVVECITFDEDLLNEVSLIFNKLRGKLLKIIH